MEQNYQVFISYSRDGGESTAKMLHDKLQNLGYRVFFDVESLRSGNFNTALYSVIDTCGDFLLVLSPGALDRCGNEDDWVRLEIEHALEQGINIIPIMLRGFTFPEELPASINEVRYKNGIESNYQFFDAFIAKLQTFLVSERPKEARKKRRIRLGMAAAVLCLLLAAGIFFGLRETGYPKTNLEKNVTSDLIYYTELNLQQFEQASEYLDKAYQACSEHVGNSGQSSYSALQAELSANRRMLAKIDTDSSVMSEEFQKELKDSPFSFADAQAMHDYLVTFIQSAKDSIDFMEEMTKDNALTDEKTVKELIENYQEILSEEWKCMAYSTNELFLPVSNEKALEEFKYTFLPELYYVNLQASNWSSDGKMLESDMERSLNAIEKIQERNMALVGNENLETMLVKAEIVQQLMSDGLTYEDAETIAEELSGRIQLVIEKKMSNKDLEKEVEEQRLLLEEKKKELEESYDEAREKFAPSADDESEILWGKMLRFMNLKLYDEAAECIDFYREKMRDENEYVEDYCAAATRFIRNVGKTGIDYGVMVVGYDPENPQHDKYLVGDVIISVDGVPCHNGEEYSKFREEMEPGQDFMAVVLREEDGNPGQLKQVKLAVPGDSPKVQLLDMTEKEY